MIFVLEFQIPIPLVVLIILISIYLVVAPVISNPSFGYLIATLIILAGLIFYYPFVYRKVDCPFICKFSYVQSNNEQTPAFFSDQCNSFITTFFGLQQAQVKI